MSVKCPVCGKECKGEPQLKFHMRVHPEYDGEQSIDLEVEQEDNPKTESVKEESQPQKKGTEFKTTVQKAISFTGRDLNMAEILINSGFAKDFSDLTRKGLHLAAALLQTGNITKGEDNMTQKDDEISTEKTMEKLLKQDLLRAQIDGMKNKSTSPIELMMMKEMIGDSKKSGGSDMSQLMMMSMMQNKNNNGNQSNPQIEQLQQQFMKMQEDKRYDDLKNLMMMQNQNKESPTDMMMKMEEMRGKRDADVEKIRMEMEATKNQMFMKELSDIRGQMNQGMEEQGFSKIMREKVDNMMFKNMETALNGGKEKSKGEMASDLISNTIEKIKEPILEPIGRAMAEKMANQPEQQYHPPEQQSPPEQPTAPDTQQPDPLDPQPNTKSEYDDLIDVSSQ